VNSVPPREDADDALLADGCTHFFEPQRERLEQLWRREHASDVVAGAQDCDRLIDDVILVRLEVLVPPLLNQLDDPARIEIDAETDASAVLREMFHREAKAPRP
jgi:hypothetical protein